MKWIFPLCRLAEITSKEAERHRLEAARNTLEAVVLDLRYKLTTEEYANAAEKGKGEAVTKKCAEVSSIFRLFISTIYFHIDDNLQSLYLFNIFMCPNKL